MTDSPAVAWSWRNAAHGAVLALPAAVLGLLDPSLALPLAVGVLPAAALGLRSTRQERALVMVVGATAAISLFLGAAVSPWPVVAVVTVFVLCVFVATLAADPTRRLAPLVLTLGLPLYGAGLSEGSWAKGLAAAALLLAGTVYGWLVSLAWPEGAASARPSHATAPRSFLIVYGVQIGLAAAVGAALGYALGVDHPGWACAAALLVSRPDRAQLDARAWGRSMSVIAGALAAALIAVLALPPAGLSVVLIALLGAAAGVSGSRSYIFPFFSTALVLALLIGDEPQTIGHWLVERVVLTIVGVLLALGAAWLVPAVARRLGAAGQASRSEP
ncbi:FUSC family protein [Microbacterium fluvii]|uniref:FUSC family protein n=1 Tax=Microbacterium fluvii TaxID=415215 RepID=A0ABW2HCB9_9MICO|nr:FUSC family protein [Microbacterium fluvii]MCU4671013.1 FUSC family protein [Microbacterium fluvii]